jgi:hypothetical protein
VFVFVFSQHLVNQFQIRRFLVFLIFNFERYSFTGKTKLERNEGSIIFGVAFFFYTNFKYALKASLTFQAIHLHTNQKTYFNRQNTHLQPIPNIQIFLAVHAKFQLL